MTAAGRTFASDTGSVFCRLSCSATLSDDFRTVRYRANRYRAECVSSKTNVSSIRPVCLPRCCRDWGRFEQIPEDASGPVEAQKLVTGRGLLPEVSRRH